MTTWAVLASGPSMSQAVADSVRGRCRVAAVSNTWRLAPWADVLVSSDAAWWSAHPEATQFAGPKYGAMPEWLEHEGVRRLPHTGSNSALLACRVAVELGATRVLLLGLDLRGDHFFGRHAPPLFNPGPDQFARFRRQFATFRPEGVEILNCTAGSALDCYPFSTIEEALNADVLR